MHRWRRRLAGQGVPSNVVEEGLIIRIFLKKIEQKLLGFKVLARMKGCCHLGCEQLVYESTKHSPSSAIREKGQPQSMHNPIRTNQRPFARCDSRFSIEDLLDCFSFIDIHKSLKAKPYLEEISILQSSVPELNTRSCTQLRDIAAEQILLGTGYIAGVLSMPR